MSDKVKCELCNGEGIDLKQELICIRCFGKGEVHWIDNITRPEDPLGYELWYPPDVSKTKKDRSPNSL